MVSARIFVLCFRTKKTPNSQLGTTKFCRFPAAPIIQYCLCNAGQLESSLCVPTVLIHYSGEWATWCGRKKSVLEGLALANKMLAPKQCAHNVYSNSLVKESQVTGSKYTWSKKEKKPQCVCIFLKTTTAIFTLSYVSKWIDWGRRKGRWRRRAMKPGEPWEFTYGAQILVFSLLPRPFSGSHMP